MTGSLRYLDLNTALRNRFGLRVQKVTLDAGFTCPNRDGTRGSGGCIYCNAQGSGSGRYRSQPNVLEQLREGILFCRRRYKAEKFLAYFQSFSNTYGPLLHLERLYRGVLAEPDVVGLSIGTRPDCLDEEKLDLLAELASSSMVWLEIGLQSASDATLHRINRGHTVAEFEWAVREAHKRHLQVCVHVILGLPGEDRSTIMHTADYCAFLGVEGVKLHQLYVERGTVMEEEYRSARYRPLSRETYVEWVVDFLERLPAQTVIQRLTGDPIPDRLVAPDWSLEKHETRRLIHQRLEERQTFQGARYAPAADVPGCDTKTEQLD
ncbi:MAG: TIGR01212 family radical SAM protein [Deltaproteobacteria bacterium]|nr:TIGR01212 family radical SAM protein [Deltaproteobacteria bacterium]